MENPHMKKGVPWPEDRGMWQPLSPDHLVTGRSKSPASRRSNPWRSAVPLANPVLGPKINNNQQRRESLFDLLDSPLRSRNTQLHSNILHGFLVIPRAVFHAHKGGNPNVKWKKSETQKISLFFPPSKWAYPASIRTTIPTKVAPSTFRNYSLRSFFHKHTPYHRIASHRHDTWPGTGCNLVLLRHHRKNKGEKSVTPKIQGKNLPLKMIAAAAPMTPKNGP